MEPTLRTCMSRCQPMPLGNPGVAGRRPMRAHVPTGGCMSAGDALQREPIRLSVKHAIMSAIECAPQAAKRAGAAGEPLCCQDARRDSCLAPHPKAYDRGVGHVPNPPNLSDCKLRTARAGRSTPELFHFVGIGTAQPMSLVSRLLPAHRRWGRRCARQTSRRTPGQVFAGLWPALCILAG